MAEIDERVPFYNTKNLKLGNMNRKLITNTIMYIVQPIYCFSNVSYLNPSKNCTVYIALAKPNKYFVRQENFVETSLFYLI